MKNMKKLIAALLLAAMALSLAACNPTRRGTNRCTICGSSNIYYNSGSYAYCYEHFQDMINYRK